MGIIKLFEQKQKAKKPLFEGQYEAHYSTIVRRIAFLTGDVHVAEELTQEVFIKLYQTPPQHENVIAWLNTVAARVAYNYIRDERSHRQKEMDNFQPEAWVLSSAEDEVLKKDEERATKEALNQLTARDRTCLLMKHSGYKYAEIAECLEIEVNAVGTIISRAQAKFKTHYEQQFEKGGIL